MGQFQNVPGPSQADFNTLSEQIGTVPSGTTVENQISNKVDKVDSGVMLQCYTLAGKQTKAITVTNPCFVFMSESDSTYEVAFCSGSTVSVISGSFGYGSTISKSGTTLTIYNGTTWNSRVWVMNYGN